MVVLLRLELSRYAGLRRANRAIRSERQRERRVGRLRRVCQPASNHATNPIKAHMLAPSVSASRLTWARGGGRATCTLRASRLSEIALGAPRTWSASRNANERSPGMPH
jgi:hypothetical protein